MAAYRNIIQTRRPGRGGGFTLIELLAVMVIIAILAAVTVPSMNAMDDTRAAMAAKELLRDLSFARQRAVATGAVTWIVFDVNAESWSILAEDPAAPGRAGASVISDFATGRTYTQTLNTGSYSGVEIVTAAFDGDVEIGFDWLGRPINAAESDLAAQGAVTVTGSHEVTVAVETGFVDYVAP